MKRMMMAKKKIRDCTKCIAYGNMLGGEENLCGLGFEVAEKIECGYRSWDVVIRPHDDKCEKISLPKNIEEFVETAKTLRIEWKLDEVIGVEEAGE